MKNRILNKNTLHIFNEGSDTTGYVFKWKDKIYRAVYKSSEAKIIELLDSGLIDELVELNIFPKTNISKLLTEDSSYVLEHTEIKSITYPQEWSFNMFKDAALLTLKVNLIANKYGYQLIDAHTGNILFDNLEPKFIDLGSFILLNKKYNSWFAKEQFYSSFFFPLKLWELGYHNIVNALNLNEKKPLSYYEYFSIKFPYLRLLPKKLIIGLFGYYLPLSRITSIHEGLIKNKLHPTIFIIFKFMKKLGIIPFQSFNNVKMMNKITKISKSSKTYWSNYQAKSYVLFKPTRRFEIIKNEIEKLKIDSLADLASNQGFFSTYLLDNKVINKLVCIDIDENSIDELFENFKVSRKNITAIVQNFVYPTYRKNELEIFDRFKSDASISLAVSHHLFLNQNISINIYFNTLKKYSNKYVITEFMPLGLWNGKYSPPTPKWYNERWFLKNFKTHFKLIKKIVIERNRILYIGKIFD